MTRTDIHVRLVQDVRILVVNCHRVEVLLHNGHETFVAAGRE